MLAATGSTDVMSNGRGLKDLKAANQLAVLTHLLDNDEPRTVRQLSEATGLTRPTVSAALDALMATSHALEVERAHAGGGGGRRSRRFIANARRHLIAGAAIRLETLEVMIADWRGTTLAHARREREDTPIREHIARCMRELLDSIEAAGFAPPGHARAHLDALTIAVIGSVGPDGIPRRNDEIPEISQAGYFDLLVHGFGLDRVVFENDARLAAEAEYARSPAPPESLLSLHIDAAVGSGIVLNGTVLTGAQGLAGEMGYAAGSGWKDSHEILLEGAHRRQMTVRELFTAAGQGEAEATALIEAFVTAISPGVMALCAAIDPKLIVVGGECTAAGTLVPDRLADSLKRWSRPVPEVALSTLGVQAVILGAVDRARREVRANARLLGVEGSPTGTAQTVERQRRVTQ